MSQKNTLKVLVIDDQDMVSEVVAFMVKYILKDFGFVEPNPIIASNPDEALAAINAARDEHFDLIISDIQCDPAAPKRKVGFEIVAHATGLMPECVAFMMTGLVLNDELYTEVLDSGAKDCFQKPIVMSDLQNRLRPYFRRK